MLISRNTLDGIYDNMGSTDIVLYDFEYEFLKDHSIKLLSYDDFIAYKSFNFNFIVIYDKNQKALKDISEISNEDWNLFNEVMKCQNFISELSYDRSEERRLEELYSIKRKSKTNFTSNEDNAKLNKEIERLEDSKYSTSFDNRKSLLNIDDMVSIIKQKLQNLYDLEKITKEELFFLKNSHDAISYIYNIAIEEELDLISHRLNKFRQNPKYTEGIENSNNREYYDYVHKKFNEVEGKKNIEKMFIQIRKELYEKKIKKITDIRRTRETYRVEIIDKMYSMKMIKFYEFYHLYSLNNDSITSNFRQKTFTNRSIQIILRYLKSQEIKNVDTDQYYKNYEKKILSLQNKKILSKKEVECLIYQDYTFIINPLNKDYIIDELRMINDNEKRSKGIYTRLIREFIFINLYRLEYDYINSYVAYKTEKLNLYNQKERKRELIRMTSEQIKYDLFEYVEELIWEIEKQVEEEKESLIYQFGGIMCIEEIIDTPSDIECFGFIRKIPSIDENSTTEDLMSLIKKIENSHITDFYENSLPYILNQAH